MGSLLGIEIGGTKLQMVRGDHSARIIARKRLNVEKTEGAAGIRHQIEHALPALLAEQKPQAIGIGFGGPVDWKTGKVCTSHQIEGWSGFDLSAWLQTLNSAPVVVDNDANVAALGEAVHGAGAGSNPVFYVTLGSGVGGGLVVDEKIFHGAPPGEAEIGHVRLDRQGTTIESRCSGWAVDASIRELARTDSQGLLGQMARRESGGEARHLSAALQQGDPAARLILEELAEALAFGLSHVTHLFHPQTIVVGGGLSHLGEPLRSAVQHYLSMFIMDAFAPGPAIRLAALGEDAVPVGALELAKRACSR